MNETYKCVHCKNVRIRTEKTVVMGFASFCEGCVQEFFREELKDSDAERANRERSNAILNQLGASLV